MTARTWAWWAIVIIAVITVCTGVAQICIPDTMLGILGGERIPISLHMFAILGMFMGLFGGMLWHAMVQATPPPIVVLWSGLQKLGAVVAVSILIQHQLLSSLAWAVVAFDFASAVLILWYWKGMKRGAA